MNTAKGPVCVVGNLNMDLIVRGVERLPEWGRGVECSSHLLTSSGQAGYLALGLGALGVACEVVGNVGNDEWGARIVGDLARAGVGTAGVEVSGSLPTAVCVAIARDGDGERAFIGSVAHLGEFDTALVGRHADRLEAAEMICVVGVFDLARFGLSGAAGVLASARRAGRATLLDTGGDPGGWPPETLRALEAVLADVDYLVINSLEAASISGEEDPWRACSALRAVSGGSVIVKCGSEGSYGLDDSGLHRVPALPVVAADAVGAGDSYDAGFIWGLRRGLSFPRAMSAATAVASIYVSRSEGRFPSAAEAYALETAGADAPSVHHQLANAKQEETRT
jgi:sugar/nucleoside kinase (ribokinase family)